MNNLSWIAGFCNQYGPQTLSLAKLFIYLGLVMGVTMAAMEAYKLYRDARAVGNDPGGRSAAQPAANPAVGEIIKGLVGALTGAKAWLALVIVGVLLLWLAGNAVPDFCKPPPGTSQSTQPPQTAPGPGATTR